MTDCANLAGHIYGPSGYVEWHEWAEQMAETHDEGRCPDCGLWVMWTPKAGRAAAAVGATPDNGSEE